MKTRILGKTGIEVSELSLGGLFVAHAQEQLEQAKETVRKAYDAGINYIDTAPSYGQSESVLGKVFAETGRPSVLSTKIGGGHEGFDPQDRDSLKRSVESSLERLGVDHIDIFMVHEPDRPGLFDWWTDMLRVEGPVLDVLLDYRKQGVIRHLGIGGTGVTELSHLVRSGKFDVVLTAFNYSLLFREAEATVIRAARENNVGVVAGSPLQQGGFAMKYPSVDDPSVYWLHPERRRQLKDLYALSDDLGLSLPEMAIRFVASNPDVHTVLMGARNPDELAQNVTAVEKGALPEDVMKELDAIAARLPARPYEEPNGLGARLSNPHGYKGPGELSY